MSIVPLAGAGGQLESLYRPELVATFFDITALSFKKQVNVKSRAVLRPYSYRSPSPSRSTRSSVSPEGTGDISSPSSPITKNARSTSTLSSSTQKPYACSQCQKGYLCEKDLNRHIRKQHTSSTVSSPSTSSSVTCTQPLSSPAENFLPDDAERPHECGICPRNYKRKEDLTRHRKTHASPLTSIKGPPSIPKPIAISAPAKGTHSTNLRTTRSKVNRVNGTSTSTNSPSKKTRSGQRFASIVKIKHQVSAVRTPKTPKPWICNKPKPFVCTLCEGKAYTAESSLTRHQESKHPEVLSSPQSTSLEGGDEKGGAGGVVREMEMKQEIMEESFISDHDAEDLTFELESREGTSPLATPGPAIPFSTYAHEANKRFHTET